MTIKIGSGGVERVAALITQQPRAHVYAPWLNPIEKLWRWLRQAVLTLHRLAGEWEVLRGRVNGFLDQFAVALLRYVGLTGRGKLARALHSV